MANQDYIGRYGHILRKLTALDTGGGQVVSAFAGPEPQPALAGPAMAPSQPALASPPPHPEDGPPVDFKSLWQNMPAQFKDQIADQITSDGTDVDAKYKAMVESGEIPAAKKAPSKHDMLAEIAEVALRTASNISRPGTESISDYADAQLAVNDRKEARQLRERQEQVGLSERRRSERLTKEEKQRDRAERLAEAEGTRAAIAEEGERTRTAHSDESKLDRQNRLDIAKLEAATRLKEHKDRKITMDKDGNMYSIGDDGKAIPITEDKEVDGKDKDGKPTKTKVTRQIKGQPKPPANGLDADTIQRQIGERLKLLQADTRLKSSLRKEGVKDIESELRKRASEQVMDEARKISGVQSPASNLYDQFD